MSGVVTGTQEKIAQLRVVLASADAPQKRIPLGLARLDEILSGGLKCGALHEIFGVASHEGAAAGFVAGLVARLGGPVLWIAQDYSLLEYGDLAATGLLELGLNPEHLVLLRVPDMASALRAAMDALSCTALRVVVIEVVGEHKLLGPVAYRKLVLAAGESGVTPLLLRFSASPSIGVVETRWQIRAAPSALDNPWGRPVFLADLQRNRSGRCGCWVLEWSGDDGAFRPADYRSVVSASVDGPIVSVLAEVSAA